MGTLTPNYDLFKPAFNEVGYDDEFATSMDTIDTWLAALNRDFVHVQDLGAANFGPAAANTIAIQRAICKALKDTDVVITSVELVSGTTYRYHVADELATTFNVSNNFVIRDMVPIGYNTPNQYAATPGTFAVTVAADRLSFTANIGSNPGPMTSTFGLASEASWDYAVRDRVAGKSVDLGWGDYSTTQTLRVRSTEGFYMRGNSARNTSLHPNKQMDKVLDIDGCSYSLFEGFSFQQGQVYSGSTASYVGGRIRVVNGGINGDVTAGYPDYSGDMLITSATWVDTTTVIFHTARKPFLSPGREFYVEGVTTAGYDGSWKALYYDEIDGNFQVYAQRPDGSAIGVLTTPAVVGTGKIFANMFYMAGGDHPVEYTKGYLIGNVVDADTFETVPVTNPGVTPNTNCAVYIGVDKEVSWGWSRTPRPGRSSTNVEFRDMKCFNGALFRLGWAVGVDNNDQTDEGTFYRTKVEGNVTPNQAILPTLYYQVGYQIGNTLYGNNLTHNVLLSGASGLRYGSRFDAVGGYITDWQSSLLNVMLHVKVNGEMVVENARCENLGRLLENEAGPVTMKGIVYTTTDTNWPADNIVLQSAGPLTLDNVAFTGGNAKRAILQVLSLSFSNLQLGTDATLEESFYFGQPLANFTADGNGLGGAHSGGASPIIVGTNLWRLSNDPSRMGAADELRSTFFYSPNAHEAITSAVQQEQWLEKQTTTAALAATIGFKRSRGAGIYGSSAAANYDIVQASDVLGSLRFYGFTDSADVAVNELYLEAAKIQAITVGGAPSVTSMPGALLFLTTAVGAITPTERMRVNPGGEIILPEMAAPGTPAANKIALYAKDSAGVSRLFYKDDAGVEHGPL